MVIAAAHHRLQDRNQFSISLLRINSFASLVRAERECVAAGS
jgi:hypothetical protein